MKKLLALLLCGTLSLSALTGCGAKEEAAEMPAQTLEEGSEGWSCWCWPTMRR